jgi:ABC-type bacteriocin/lantibiotic exporter with double-glycine peptidase domain
LAPLERFSSAAQLTTGPAADPLDVCCRVLAGHLGVPAGDPLPPADGDRDAAGAAAGRLEQYGLRARPVRLAGDWRREAVHPLLAFRRDGSPVVLLPAGRRGFRLVSPVTGVGARLDADTAAGLGAWAYEVTAPLPTARLRDVLGHARRRADVYRLVAAGLTAAALGGLLPATGSLALTAVLGHRSGVLRELTVLSAFGLLAYAGLVLLRNLAVARMESYAEAVLGPAVLDRLLRARAWLVGAYPAGDLVTRLAGVDTVRRLLGTATLSAALNLVFGLTGLVVIAVLEPLASVPALGAVVLAALFAVRFGRRQLTCDRTVFTAYGQASATLSEIVRGLDKVRVAGREEHAFRRWLAVFTGQKRADLAAARWQASTAALLAALPALLYALLLVGPHYLGGRLGAAGLLALNIALSQFVAALAQAGSLTTALYGAVPVVDRILEVVRLEQEPAGAAPGPLSSVRLRGVTVRPPGGADVLHEVDLEVRPGELVGVVGPSGAGKSTLVRVMLGLVPCAAGSVRFDGRDLAELDPVAVRRRLAAVLQDAAAPGRDIRTAVAGGRPGVDDAAVWEALELAGLAEEVRAMPMGLATPVGSGSRLLSGGQRQRMAIARALAGRPGLLVLDEATSGLDSRTETALLDRIAATVPARLVVTHRVETLACADRIVVLDEGRVAATGTYSQLLAGCPLFAALAAEQPDPAAAPGPAGSGAAASRRTGPPAKSAGPAASPVSPATAASVAQDPGAPVAAEPAGAPVAAAGSRSGTPATAAAGTGATPGGPVPGPVSAGPVPGRVSVPRDAVAGPVSAGPMAGPAHVPGGIA